MIATQPLRAYRSKLFQKFERIYAKQVDGSGLAVFRIVFCSVLLAEVAHMFYFRHLIFDPIPFVEPAEIGSTVPLVLWMATLLLLILGLHTRPAAVANYGFALMIFSSLKTYAYMMTPVYVSLSFLFLFLPISRRLSLDRLRLELRHSGPRFRYHPPATVSQLAYYAPVVVGIAFVYFDSALYKLTSPLWLAGLGMWKPLSLPYETPFNNSFILNQEWLVKALGYLTLVFELFFLFLFPFRRCRPVLLVIGVGLHAGILFALPLPFFAVGFGSIYLLMVPIGYWRRWFSPRAGPRRLTFYYDAAHPLCVRTRLLVEHLDRRGAVRFRGVLAPAVQEPPSRARREDVYGVAANGRAYRGPDAYIQVFRAVACLKPLSWLLRLPGVYSLGQAVYRSGARRRPAAPGPDANRGPASPIAAAAAAARPGATRSTAGLAGAAIGLAGLTLLQGLASYDAPFVRRLRRDSGLENTRAGRALARASVASMGPARKLFGITSHPIALDEHFAGYTRLVAITYTGADGVERFLPITRPSGQPGPYLSGAIWLKWTYSIVTRRIDQQRLEQGIRDFTAFWASKHRVDLNNCRFKVKVKKIADPTHWEPDFLNQQLKAEWRDAGVVTWQHQQFTAHLANIGTM